MPPAQTLLGVLLSRGLGVKQDLAAAADWYGLAGKAGDREALYALGQLYLEGQGVEQDPVEGGGLFQAGGGPGPRRRGARARLPAAAGQGRGEERHARRRLSAARRGLGDMDAQYTLAGLYVEGVGVVADEAQAARWFGEAAQERPCRRPGRIRDHALQRPRRGEGRGGAPPTGSRAPRMPTIPSRSSASRGSRRGPRRRRGTEPRRRAGT